MAWNSGGGPWGGPSGGPPGGGRPPGGSPPGSPWGGGGRRRPPIPDPEQLLARLVGWLRGLLPSRWRGPQIPGLPGGGVSYPRIGVIAVAVIVLAWLASGFYVVQPDEQGVVLRFGAFVGTTAPGLNYHLPWPIESVLLPSVTRVNRIEIGYRSTAGQPGVPAAPSAQDVTAESLMLTGDQNIVDINFAVFWRIANAEQYLFAIRHPEATIKAVAESVMREVVGHNPIEPLLTTARAAVETEVRRDMQAILDQYGAGVEITEVQLLKVDPPPEVIDSFRDVQRAGTDADRARNNAESYRNNIVPRARGEAARIIAEGEATKAADIAAATGNAERFLSVLAAYRQTKSITLDRLYLDTMQSVLAKSHTIVLGAGVDRLLPLLSLPTSPASPSGAPASKPISGGTP
ncbi:MAG TPA: FtsH protease activity modulator HflK [Acetobacteraceae bacterium]|nr:FtsH protease activity modulator HflK [Acetobacteraceae bacterium]